jgi:hypothetical protein
MDKETLSKLLKTLSENSIKFKLDTYINKGKGVLRGIFIYKPEDVDNLKNVIEKNILDSYKFKKSYSWYLGERRKTLVLRPRKEIELEIPEIEQFEVNNYL